MKVLLDIPKELLDKLYDTDMGYFSIDVTLAFTHNHKSDAEKRKYQVKEAWTNDGYCQNFRFVTMDD